MESRLQEKTDDAENRRSQAELEAEVKQGGYVFYRGAGVPDEEVWEPETSILVVALGREEAVKFGKIIKDAGITAR